MRLLDRLFRRSPLDEPPCTAAALLQERMAKPQRHRLLHGYPQYTALQPATQIDDDFLDLHFRTAPERGLLLGVLPHPYCNPAVTGCGFCTFPHEPGNSAKSAAVVKGVIHEIEDRLLVQSSLAGCAVKALYFGGGTANLTEAGAFKELCQALAKSFDFKQAEVTLEGVPAYFLREPLLLDILREHLPARHYRLSMGIQTFAEPWLQRMGRLAFGTADTFRAVVEQAHARGCTVSGDLLFNLPGQTLVEMRHDVEQAIAIGLDHIGLYHLVLFEKLGTAWSREPELLAALPSNEQAATHWAQLRAQLLEAGFYQTTLTNFERASFREQPQRFQYEECSFHPDRCEMLGFGPSAICYVADQQFQQGIKTVNPTAADAYLRAVGRLEDRVWDRYYHYEPEDQRIFYLTRRLAALEISRPRYQELFGCDPVLDFDEEVQALQEAGLVEVTPWSVQPTVRGMFYGDSIAVLWAWKRLWLHRSQRRRDMPALPAALTRDRLEETLSSSHGHMG